MSLGANEWFAGAITNGAATALLGPCDTGTIIPDCGAGRCPLVLYLCYKGVGLSQAPFLRGSRGYLGLFRGFNRGSLPTTFVCLLCCRRISGPRICFNGRIVRFAGTSTLTKKMFPNTLCDRLFEACTAPHHHFRSHCLSLHAGFAATILMLPVASAPTGAIGW
jgi:hypothetical protein